MLSAGDIDSGDVVVAVQVLGWDIVLWHFARRHFRDIGRLGVFDALNRIRFERISLFYSATLSEFASAISDSC